MGVIAIERKPDEYTIEHDVPMPAPKAVYPFAVMKMGDSFALSQEKLNNVRNAAQAYGKRHDQKFRFRQVGTEVWRCWRTA